MSFDVIRQRILPGNSHITFNDPNDQDGSRNNFLNWRPKERRIHGGVDMNYVGGQFDPANQAGASTVYSPLPLK
jgi:hypothetical protein